MYPITDQGSIVTKDCRNGCPIPPISLMAKAFSDAMEPMPSFEPLSKYYHCSWSFSKALTFFLLNLSSVLLTRGRGVSSCLFPFTPLTLERSIGAPMPTPAATEHQRPILVALSYTHLRLRSSPFAPERRSQATVQVLSSGQLLKGPSVITSHEQIDSPPSGRCHVLRIHRGEWAYFLAKPGCSCPACLPGSSLSPPVAVVLRRQSRSESPQRPKRGGSQVPKQLHRCESFTYALIFIKKIRSVCYRRPQRLFAAAPAAVAVPVPTTRGSHPSGRGSRCPY